MTDEDIYAFRPAPPPAATPRRPRRRWWPWLLAAGLLLGLLAALALVSSLFGLVDSAAHGVHLQIDGDDWNAATVDVDGLRTHLQSHWGVVLLGLTLALSAVFVVVALVVPMAVLLTLLAVALAIGVALLAVLGVAAVVLAPLWLIGLLLWLLLRRRPSAA